MKTFISYSHSDDRLKRRLEKHLAGLVSAGKLTAWSDRDLLPGDRWSVEIEQRLDAAELILLLISPSFLASEACQAETRRALERTEGGAAILVPVVLHACDWTHLPFGSFQAATWNGDPPASAVDVDEAMTAAVRQIRRLVDARAGDKRAAPGAPKRPDVAVKRNFSDFEKDTFLDEAFERIVALLETWLGELEREHSDIRVRGRREGSSRFTCTIYRGDRSVSAGTVFLASDHGSRAIRWVGQETTESNSWNEEFRVEVVSNALRLTSIGMLHLGGADVNRVGSAEGAAEALYTSLTEPLRWS